MSTIKSRDLSSDKFGSIDWKHPLGIHRKQANKAAPPKRKLSCEEDDNISKKDKFDT